MSITGRGIAAAVTALILLLAAVWVVLSKPHCPPPEIGQPMCLPADMPRSGTYPLGPYPDTGTGP